MKEIKARAREGDGYREASVRNGGKFLLNFEREL
jgi:hypothetical protein